VFGEGIFIMKSHDSIPWTSNCARDSHDRLSKMTLEQVVTKAAQVYGVNIASGFKKPREVRHCKEYSDRPFSFGNLRRAFFLKQSPGHSFTWQTHPVTADLESHSVFVFEFAMGNGSPIFQATGQFDLEVNGVNVLSFRVNKYSDMWWNNELEIAFSYTARTVKSGPLGVGITLDSHIVNEGWATFGLGLLRVPNRVLNDDKTIDVTIRSHSPGELSEQWVRVGDLPNVLVDNDYYDGLFRVCSNERIHATVGEYTYYMGDIHNHSGESRRLRGQGCGRASAEEVFQYARDVSNLDFFALTEHDWQMNEDDWRHILDLCKTYHAPGQFVTIPAQEWTSQNFGHRNVYYEREGAPLLLCDVEGRYNTIDDRNPSPVDLWQQLDEIGIPCMTISHHPSVGQFPLSMIEYYNPAYDPCIEIYSSWGSSEYAYNALTDGADRFEGLNVIDVLQRGIKVGFVASSDSHDGHPGNAQGAPGHRDHLFHYLGSGRTFVLAKELTRESVFEAIRQRRCYATTGAPIILSFTINDAPMGADLIVADPRVTIQIDVRGPSELERIDLVKNGAIVKSFIPLGRSFKHTFTDEALDDAHFYYVRVLQKDQEMAWSSPIWIS